MMYAPSDAFLLLYWRATLVGLLDARSRGDDTFPDLFARVPPKMPVLSGHAKAAA